jgi:hemerythrin
MPPIVWTDEYAVGVETLDAQHRTLLEVACRFEEAARAGRDRRAGAALLEELLRYVGAHFAHEERMMARHGYPGLETHRRLHRGLGERVAASGAQQAAGASREPAQSVTLIIEWLRAHILETDKPYGPFFAGKGAV